MLTYPVFLTTWQLVLLTTPRMMLLARRKNSSAKRLYCFFS